MHSEPESNDDAKRNPDYGYCPQCKKANHELVWCNSCDRKALVDKFNAWSTGSEVLDSFIQETQRTANYYNYLEYVPYDRFADAKLLARGGFGEVLTAMWLDGKRIGVEKDGIKDNWGKGRTKPFQVVLKIVNNSATDQSFISELKLYHQFYQERSGHYCKCYGITKDPKTMNYALILQYFPDGDLRRSLTNPDIKLTWKDKLRHLWCLCINIKGIHECGYVHRDIHSGNILLNDFYTHLIDLGLTQLADSPQEGVFGVVPYMAPELFRGSTHSKASDIYAVGIIMSEYASNEPAFCDRDHNTHLQLEIADGLRPEVPPEIPECYKILMNRCLSENPLDRPSAGELRDLFNKWWIALANDKDTDEVKQFKVADEQWKPKQRKERHPGAVYTSRLVTNVTKSLTTDYMTRSYDLDI